MYHVKTLEMFWRICIDKVKFENYEVPKQLAVVKWPGKFRPLSNQERKSSVAILLPCSVLLPRLPT